MKCDGASAQLRLDRLIPIILFNPEKLLALIGSGLFFPAINVSELKPRLERKIDANDHVRKALLLRLIQTMDDVIFGFNFQAF